MSPLKALVPRRLKPLAGTLEDHIGKPLTEEFLQGSLRQLYATGLYDTVEVAGEREGAGVALVFRGQPRMFIGTVSVDGAKGPTVNAQLERASQLTAGTPLTQAKLARASDQMRETLATSGYYDPVISRTLTQHAGEQLTDIAYRVNSGPLARVGTVEVTGDSGMSLEEFRRAAHLQRGSHVDRDTANRALDGVLKHYQNEDRLQADVKLASQQYAPATRTVNFRFTANRGPVVRVLVEGASMSADRVKRLVPIFEEGSVDEDLLNEGSRRLRDYYQQLGYFDVKVTHSQHQSSAGATEYRIQRAPGTQRPCCAGADHGKSLF